LPVAGPPTPEPIPLHLRAAPTGATPYDVVSAVRDTTRVPKSLLLPMSRHLEERGRDATEPIVVLACFQDVTHFRAGTRRRFARLAEHAAFVGAVGADMPASPVPDAPRVLGGRLATDDRLRGEWDVIAIGPHFAGALVARDCGDIGPDDERRFDFAITHDRDLVIRAARSLLSRLVPAAGSGVLIPAI
jgi:DICT domain-containing protein